MSYASDIQRSQEQAMDDMADAAAGINAEFDCHPREAASAATEVGADSYSPLSSTDQAWVVGCIAVASVMAVALSAFLFHVAASW